MAPIWIMWRRIIFCILRIDIASAGNQLLIYNKQKISEIFFHLARPEKWTLLSVKIAIVNLVTLQVAVILNVAPVILTRRGEHQQNAFCNQK